MRIHFKKMGLDRKFVNVLMLGAAFMLLFTAFQTSGIIEKTVLESIHAEDPSFTADGYTSLAIIYAAFAVANWIAPSVISVISAKWTMVIGALPYVLFIAAFLKPTTWLVYLLSAFLGIGAALLWTGQGNFLTLNSDGETMVRNSGIFWAMMQTSLLFGNLFVFFEFEGQKVIEKSTRTTVFSALLGVSLVGYVVFLFLRSVTESTNDVEPGLSRPINASGEEVPRRSGPKEAFVAAARLFVTPDMMLLSLTFFYSGVELSFFSGVYSAAIGFTESLGTDAARFVGISGMLIGVGEITGGLLFGIMGDRTIKYGRDPVVLLACFAHLLAFFLIFINLPNESVFGSTAELAYINSKMWLALICSYLLGFGDACYNTQLYAIVGSLYSEDSAPAFALYKFAQSVAAAIAFFYSSHVGLYYQLLILTISCVIGTVAFCAVVWKQDRDRESYQLLSGRNRLRQD